jgi:arsenite transporter
MTSASETHTTRLPDLPISKEDSTNTPTDSPYPSDKDVELQAQGTPRDNPSNAKVSAFKSLGLLDRFLAVWILLAMIIGVILGNFVPNTGPALQKGQFVGVSVPIGKETYLDLIKIFANLPHY